ncbi:hypothetical protein [Nicoliella lavandulae]|uniref:Uncharacterized protein n=1 Tax=Nicoliella lavandulae TaxID=3082954 RepID=A0ABU8SJB2_9LACO
MLAILFAVATWLILYAGLVLIVFYLIFIFWRWLLEHHPKLSKKLGLYIINNWLMGVNNGQTKRNVIILFIIVLILIWLVKR